MGIISFAKRTLPHRILRLAGIHGIRIISKNWFALRVFSLIMDSRVLRLRKLPDGKCSGYYNGRNIICHRDGFRIFHEIFNIRPYEKYWSPVSGDTVIDLGAYVGVFSIRASTLVGPSGRVIVVEPDQRNLELLRTNLRGLSNVSIIPAAVSDHNGTIDLYLSAKTTCHNTIDPSNRTSRVEALTIDTLVSKLKLDRVDFIKMDVEGAEMLALIGGKETLKGNVRLAIECYHLSTRKRPTQEQLIRFLENNGYRAIEEEEYIYAQKEVTK